ncbi:MAG: FtsQ-type POTRA domain-containing protein [Verrucomicrobia bacterium]|nr:FtsQ-type POTRA domain-containing protein [Verrucomicrobiota bacterium]
MVIKRTTRKQNRRASTLRQRRQQHLLDVKVRAHKAAAQRTQRLVFFGCVLVTVLAVVGGVAFGTRTVLNALFFKNPDYRVKTIDVVADGNLTRDAVLRACNLSEGINLLSVDLPTIRERLGNLPQVEDSRLERILPDHLVIRIQERRPVAWVISPETNLPAINYDHAYLIDRRGVLLKTKAIAPEYLGLPAIVGINTANYVPGQALDQDEVRAALDLIRMNSEILQTRFQIRSIDVSKGYCLVATDRQKASVTFNLDNLEWQLHRLESLLNYCEHNSRELRTANLMAERNMPVTFVPDDTPEILDEPEEPVRPAITTPTGEPKATARAGGRRTRAAIRRMKGGTIRKATRMRHVQRFEEVPRNG